MTEERLLAAVLRRFMAGSENYVGTNGGWWDAALTLDGSVDLTPEEGALVFRLVHGIDQ